METNRARQTTATRATDGSSAYGASWAPVHRGGV